MSLTTPGDVEPLMNSAAVISPHAVVGSLNPVKIEAARLALEIVYGVKVTTVGRSVGSSVSAMPATTEETLLGAITRAYAVLPTEPGGIGIGLEGGLTTVLGRTYCIGWAVVTDRAGHYEAAPTVGVRVPEPVLDLVRSGLELGDAEDIHFHRTNSKQKCSLIGIVTDGRVERIDTLYPALVTALSALTANGSHENGGLNGY